MANDKKTEEAIKIIEDYSKISTIKDVLEKKMPKAHIDNLRLLWNEDKGYVRKDEHGIYFPSKTGECLITEMDATSKAKIVYDTAFNGNPPEGASLVINAYAQAASNKCAIDKGNGK